MAYSIDTDPIGDAIAETYKTLRARERELIANMGRGLDAGFNAIWSPPAPATVQGMVASCANTFLARLQTHYALSTILLSIEAANGVDSSRHPWAHKQEDGSYIAGIPVGWGVIPVFDATGALTGAATVSYTPPQV